MKRNSKQATQPPKKPKVKSPWCLSDEEKADNRSRDIKALEHAKELEHRLRGTIQTRRTDGNAIITATPAKLAQILAAIG